MDSPPTLDWSDDGTPRSRQFSDIYFSPDDGLAESRAVFLAGCHLPEAWTDRRIFVVGELGFGTGLNILALMDLWRRERRAAGHLHIFSIEAYPLAREDAARALAPFSELADITQTLLDLWPPVAPGWHRISPAGWNLTLDLFFGDVAEGLAAWEGQADAWFLDGFAPSTNPDMWTPAVLRAVADRSVPGARLATFTVAGAVRRGLTEAGFSVAKVPGHGRKRERLEATLTGSRPAPASPPRVAVVGAGIAGAALTRALGSYGVSATVIEAIQPGAGGSGFPAALVTPRLDAGDQMLAGLAAQAVRRAMALYREIPGAVIDQGIIQRPGRKARPHRFERIADLPVWAKGEMRTLALEPTNLAPPPGTDPDANLGPALDMQLAGSVRPQVILSAWLAQAHRVQGHAQNMTFRPGGGWHIGDDQGRDLGEFDWVVLAAAQGCRTVTIQGQPLPWPLGCVAGQADWVVADAPPVSGPQAWGGYLVPFDDAGLLFGATHDRGEEHPRVSTYNTQRNLSTLAEARPDLAEALTHHPDVKSRVAVRAVTPDRLPLADALPAAIVEQPGLAVLTGLGSRGFAWAPLLAEHIASLIVGSPSPLGRAQAERLKLGRFGQWV